MEPLASKIRPIHKLAYISPKLQDSASSIQGGGLFAVAPIIKRELLLDFTAYKDRYVTALEADRLYAGGFDHLLQVDDDRFILTVQGDEPSAFGHVNHSCDPNCGIRGSFEFVAMRDIKLGEEITIDYAMIDSSDYKIKCKCGSGRCRGVITGNDWKSPGLQKRYAGYFSKYLAKKIWPVKTIWNP